MSASRVHSQLQNATFGEDKGFSFEQAVSSLRNSHALNLSRLVVKSISNGSSYNHRDSNDLILPRSTGTLNRGPNAKQKISFSRKFPFMKSRERLNKLDDDESFENGSNHRWQDLELFYLPCCIPCFYNPLHPYSLLSNISEK